MADPGHGNLTWIQSWEYRPLVLSLTPGQQRFPHHLVKKAPRVERLGGCEVLERARQALFLPFGPMQMGTFDFHSRGCVQATYTSRRIKYNPPA